MQVQKANLAHDPEGIKVVLRNLNLDLNALFVFIKKYSLRRTHLWQAEKLLILV